MTLRYRINQDTEEAFLYLPEEEYAPIGAAHAGVSAVFDIEELYDVFLSNHLALEELLLRTAAQRLVHRPLDFDPVRRACHRAVANVLSSARAFFDQAARVLSSLEIEMPGAVEHFKSLRSAEYDKSLGFRVLEALRNYSQHYSFSVSGMTYGGRRVSDLISDKQSVIVRPIIHLSQLEADPSFKASVLEELKSLVEARSEFDSPSFDVLSFARDYVSGIASILSQMRTFFSSKETDWWNTLELSIQRYGRSQARWGSSTIVLEKVDSTDTVLTQQFVNTYSRALIEGLRNANRPLPHLHNVVIYQ
jgi:hypothetical protein